jgi:hypothetical protein
MAERVLLTNVPSHSIADPGVEVTRQRYAIRPYQWLRVSALHDHGLFAANIAANNP